MRAFCPIDTILQPFEEVRCSLKDIAKDTRISAEINMTYCRSIYTEGLELGRSCIGEILEKVVSPTSLWLSGLTVVFFRLLKCIGLSITDGLVDMLWR